MIQVKNIYKSFRQSSQNIPVLKGISLQVQKSESLSVVGPSGSGKTTLLSLLAGLEYADQGEIIINNSFLQKMDEKELSLFRSKNIGIVFQHHHLLPHLTALENVMLPLEIAQEKNIKKKAEMFLERVGLSHRLHHLPRQMSGGECQRTAIARASVLEPPILLADEPSGHLDSESGEKAMDVLFSLAKNSGTTLILVTHNMDLSQKTDRRVKILKGLIHPF